MNPSSEPSFIQKNLDRLKRFLAFQKLWKVIACLLFINLGFQSFSLKEIKHLNDWDLHQISFMGAPSDIFNAENSVNTFQTYGPLFPYLRTYVGPFDESDPYWGHLAYILLVTSILAIFISKIKQKYAPFILCIFFSLYNFPWIVYSPLILTLWSLSLHKEFKYIKCFSFLGVLLASILFLYKASWGIIAIIQLLATVTFHPYFNHLKNRVIYGLSYLITIGALTVVFYLSLTTDGTIETYFNYISVSLADAKHYTELMMTPLSFAENLYLLIYPLIVGFILILFLFFRIEEKKFWLPFILFPIIFAEYKHSYVRADVTNLFSIFWIFPLILFFLLLRYWQLTKFRLVNLSLLIMLTIPDLLSWTPYNIPWRHPRQIWIKTPHQYDNDFKQYQAHVKEALETRLKENQWVSDQVKDASLLVQPGYLLDSLLSAKPYILPSNQSYFSREEREALDIAKLENQLPNYFLFQDVLLDKRIPMSYSPSFFKKILSHSQLIDKKEETFLFKINEKQKVFEDHLISNYQVNHGKITIDFKAPKGIMINLKTKGLVSIVSKFQNLVLKGNRVKIKYTQGQSEKDIRCCFSVLEKGTIFVPDLTSLVQENHQLVEHKLVFEGYQLNDHPYDPAYYLHYDKDFSLELSYSILKSKP